MDGADRENMCALCGRPGVVHNDEGGFPTAAVQAGEASSGSSGTGAAALSVGAQAEISYLNGLTSVGTIAGTSFWTWNYDTPATYSSTSYAAKWGSPTPGTSGGTVTYWFDAASAWTATEKAALQSGLALWSALANINFALSSSASTANFIFYENSSGTAYENGSQWTTSVGSSLTGSHTSTGTVISIDTDVAGFGPLGASFGTYGGYPYQTFLHEIGHLIGLGHGGSYNGDVNVATQQFSAYDTRLWTIMSYIDPWTSSAKYYGSYPVTGTNWGISADGYYNRPTTPMILDIAAAQQLYGAATAGPLVGGNHVFGFNSNLASSIKAYFDFTVNTNPVITIWASGTNNTLDLSGWSNPATINLNPGTFSSAHGLTNNIGIAEGAVIDKAVGGGGNDSITGNSYDNALTGKGGSDAINGGGGNDTAVYGGFKSQYQITKNPDGSIRLVDLRSGSPDGTDTVSNVEFFQFADGTVTAASLFNAAPVVTVPNATVNASSTAAILLSGLFSASDSDGDTLVYLFYDSTVGGGRIYLNGVAQPEGNNQGFLVTAAQLSQVTFVPGPGSSDDLQVGAGDGTSFSGWKNLHINGPVNHAPVVTVPTATVNASSTAAITMSTLFSASDSDGNALSYSFKDNSTGGGHFYLNGVMQADSQAFSVASAQLSQVTYVPATASSDDLQIGASDGTLFSGWSNLHVNGPANNAPVVTVPNATVNASSTAAITMSTLFSASDSDGDTLVYLFYDATVGGGRIYLNGLAQPEGNNQGFLVTAAQLSQVTFVPGSGSSDDLQVGASDGTSFSGWKNLHINGPVNQAPVVTVPNSTVAANAGDTLQLSGLVSATDAGADTFAYLFYDSTAGGGHFEVNGSVQPANTIFGVASSQLSQVTFVAGSGTDDLLVGATDGTFSGWSSLHIV
jgi:Peptidase M10 serralysin C terminal